MERAGLDLDDFQHVAGLYNGVSKDMPSVLDRLFQKVRKDLERESAAGLYMVPGCIRVDARTRSRKMVEEVSAAFISMPLFSLEPWRQPSKRLHSPINLVQSQYDRECIAPESLSDLVCSSNGISRHSGLVVSAFWCLILGNSERQSRLVHNMS
jgi:hypothetical protein